MQYSRKTRRPTPGHSGNRKNVIVEWRYSEAEIAERKADGIDSNPDWQPVSNVRLTQKQATYYRIMFEKLGFLTRERNI